jgi:hypothetical protein
MRIIAIVVLTVLTAASAQAAVIEGVNVPESVTVADTPLALNGAGVRKRFFMKIYVGALYLPTKSSSAEALIAAGGAKSVRLHFLYEELETKKLVDAWNSGFKNNHGDAELEALRPRLERFNGYFRTVKRGDTIVLNLMPNGDTHVLIGEEKRGEIAGADFQKALLNIWLGREPADDDLKRAMLGAKE